MLSPAFSHNLTRTLEQIAQSGLFKKEKILAGPQEAHIRVRGNRTMLNFCANNYLGLANHPDVVNAARDILGDRGYGVASVRFICGTQDIHTELEQRLSRFLGTEDTILYGSCFDANGGLFETLLTDEDAVISDELNHASIIDGIRLCKAARYRYRNNDPEDLEARLQEADHNGARFKLIATDAVFSMDGTIADLSAICDLADKYDALLMIDDCHGCGFLGPRGRGTHEHADVMGRVDIITGTLGKALGGASGGFTSGPKPIIDLLRQRSRPYLFSNSLAPSIVAASLQVLDMLETSTALRDRLMDLTASYRTQLTAAGLPILHGEHPIVPIMVGDAALSQQVAQFMMEQGIYVVGFFYPVVPRGKARIRTQVSAAHTHDDIARVVATFSAAQKHFGF